MTNEIPKSKKQITNKIQKNLRALNTPIQKYANTQIKSMYWENNSTLWLPRSAFRLAYLPAGRCDVLIKIPKGKKPITNKTRKNLRVLNTPIQKFANTQIKSMYWENNSTLGLHRSAFRLAYLPAAGVMS